MTAAAFAEEKSVHVFFDQFQGVRVGGVEAVLVDDGGQPFQPLNPALLGNIFKHPLSQFPRIGRGLEGFGFLIQDNAMNGSGWHFNFTSWGAVEL